MTPKGPPPDDTRSALRELIDRSEEVVGVFVEELTGSSNLRQELGKTLERANLARKTVDRNLEAVLGALNLPTRRDYMRLVEEIHALQGSIVNLNMKMDRLLAAQAAAMAAGPKPAADAAGVPNAARAARSKTTASAARPKSTARAVDGPKAARAARPTARPKTRARKAAPAKSRKRGTAKKSKRR